MGRCEQRTGVAVYNLSTSRYAWVVAGAVTLLGTAATAGAANLAVPGSFATIQAALDAAVAGDEIHVASGRYSEKLVFSSGGDALNGPIVLRAAPGALTAPVLDGAGVVGANMIVIDSLSYVHVVGLELVNNLAVNDGSGIRVLGAGTDIEIRDNIIHEMRGKHAMGITVYGTEPSPIQNLVIDNNQIFDCEPSRSEALTINGNVDGFVVTNNLVRDVNNIGIDFIGGEVDIQPDPNLVARNGVVRGNTVARARSNYAGGFAGGIYVDGGRDIVIENNSVSECDLGIEVGAENAGLLTTNVTVRNNLVFHNDKAGIVFGGFASGVGRANGNVFRGNTLYANNTLSQSANGEAEVWVQFAEDNLFEGNIVVADGQGGNVVVSSFAGSVGNVFDHNVYYTVNGLPGSFTLNGVGYSDFASWRSGSGNDTGSVFASAQLVDAAGGDFHIAKTSPAVDSGGFAYIPAPSEVDLDGSKRLAGLAVDAGVDETGCGDGIVDNGEDCDDGNSVNGDGCDNNCSFTGCGNGIVTASEQCDVGVPVGLDCCSASCLFEPSSSVCSDGLTCTLIDLCDASGVCVGSAQPDPSCVNPLSSGASQLRLKSKNGKDSLSWKWRKGPELALATLGDPTLSTLYTVCLYRGLGATGSILIEARAPAGASWRGFGAKGFKYKDAGLSPDGLKLLQLRPGLAGKARLKVKGKGPNLGLSSGLAFDPSATLALQLRNSTGACYGAGFSSPFIRNQSSIFIDKSD